MNDFTKEELIEIKEYCNWEPPAPGHSDFRQNIWRKLEALIDNYCEHLNDPRFNAMPCADSPKLCSICGGFYL